MPSITTDTQKSQAAALSGAGSPPHSAWCLLPTLSMPVSDSSSVHFLGEACLISLARSNALIIILSRHNLTCICMNIDFFSLQNVYFVCPLQHSRTHTEPGTEKVVNKSLRSRIRLPPWTWDSHTQVPTQHLTESLPVLSKAAWPRWNSSFLPLPVTQSIPKLVFPLSVNYTIPDAHAKNFWYIFHTQHASHQQILSFSNMTHSPCLSQHHQTPNPSSLAQRREPPTCSRSLLPYNPTYSLFSAGGLGSQSVTTQILSLCSCKPSHTYSLHLAQGDLALVTSLTGFSTTLLLNFSALDTLTLLILQNANHTSTSRPEQFYLKYFRGSSVTSHLHLVFRALSRPC